MAATPVLVDCDTGVDDALALLYLLDRPSVEVVGVTTVFGNTQVEQCTANTVRVLDLAGRPDIPVGSGAATARAGEPDAVPSHIHGDDGLGDTGMLAAPSRRIEPHTAVPLIDELTDAHRGRIRLLATGALTNLAEALDAIPDLVERVADIVIMGGAADAPGNRTPAAESNIIADPEAAQRVLTAGWPITLVPLDVTMTEVLTDEQVARLAASARPVARFAAGVMRGYLDHYEQRFGRRQAAMHDPLAAGILVGDSVPVLAPQLHVEVDCSDGPSRGATVVDTRMRYAGFRDAQDRATTGNCRVVLETDGGFSERLTRILLAG